MTRILCPHLGQPDSGSCSPLSYCEGLCEWGEGGSFNQHDETCHPPRLHTHTCVQESGHMLRGSGLAVMPSLVQAYMASFWHMSKELHSTYRKRIRIMQRQQCLYEQCDCQKTWGKLREEVQGSGGGRDGRERSCKSMTSGEIYLKLWLYAGVSGSLQINKKLFFHVGMLQFLRRSPGFSLRLTLLSFTLFIQFCVCCSTMEY